MGPLVAIKHDNLAILPSASPKQLKGLSRGRIRLYMVFLYAFSNHLQLTFTWGYGTGLDGLLTLCNQFYIPVVFDRENNVKSL